MLIIVKCITYVAVLIVNTEKLFQLRNVLGLNNFIILIENTYSPLSFFNKVDSVKMACFWHQKCDYIK